MADFQSLLSYGKIFLDIRTGLIGLVVFLILAWVAKSYLEQPKNLPPGPRSWPVIGCVPQLLRINAATLHDLFQTLSRKYGPVCCLPTPFGNRAVIISGYQAVHESLTRSELNWRPPLPHRQNNANELMNGLGVIMSSGEPWKEQRRFSLTVLRSFGVGKRSFEDQIATESENLIKEIQSRKGNAFDPTHLFCNAVSNVICSVVFGKRFDYDDLDFNNLLHWLEDSVDHLGFNILFMLLPTVVSILTKIPFFPKGPLPSILSIRQKLKDTVDEHRAALDSENLRDFIDAYLNDMQVKEEQGVQTHLNNVELLTVVNDLFLAGTETTSTTLRWALLYMLSFPEVQTRVHDEIDTVVGRDRLPKLSDKPNLPYTVAVIHEIQRYASIVLITAPRYAVQDTEFQGFTIPKGSYIFPNLASVTRDPLIWENPDAFQPERFLDEKGQVKKIPEQIVFGAGKRVCLGEQLARMELFIFFTHLMHQFSFKKPTATGSLNIRPKVGGVLTPFPYNICAITRS